MNSLIGQWALSVMIIQAKLKCMNLVDHKILFEE